MSETTVVSVADTSIDLEAPVASEVVVVSYIRRRLTCIRYRVG